MSDETYDLFVSYRQGGTDGAWVRTYLVPRLQAAGLSVCVDYLSFGLGAPVIREMERAVLASRFTVVVMSTTYFQSAFTDLEAILARHVSLERRASTVLALRLEQDLLPPLEFRVHLWLDVFDEGALEPAMQRLVATIGGSAGA